MNDLPVWVRFTTMLIAIAYLTYVYLRTFEDKALLTFFKTVLVFTIWFIGMMSITTIVGITYLIVQYQQDPTIFSK